MWCILEIFVFIQMGGLLDDVELHFLPCCDGSEPPSPTATPDTEDSDRNQRDENDGDDENSLSDAVIEYYDSKFAEFDVHNADCYDRTQKDHLLAIIEAGFGGTDGFNTAVSSTLQLLREIAASRGRQPDSRRTRNSYSFLSTSAAW